MYTTLVIKCVEMCIGISDLGSTDETECPDIYIYGPWESVSTFTAVCPRLNFGKRRDFQLVYNVPSSVIQVLNTLLLIAMYFWHWVSENYPRFKTESGLYCFVIHRSEIPTNLLLITSALHARHIIDWSQTSGHNANIYWLNFFYPVAIWISNILSVLYIYVNMWCSYCEI